ncbi:MAG: cation diffusion facilitator family transporter [Clostridiales bacterium]|nr:cation diffusion facilitator family transporter [Clostridiales bacterium]
MQKYTEVKKVAIYGFLGNVLLLISKLTVGFMTHSQSMIADGLNSAGDVFASSMTYIGNYISSRPADHTHPYGHGKAEYIFSLIISFSFLLVAFAVFRSSLNSIIVGTRFHPSLWLSVTAFSTIVSKFFLYAFSKKVSVRYDSLLAHANAEDHRNDMFISSLTVISIISGHFGLFLVDNISGILIALWIAFSGFKIFSSAYNILMDTNMDENLSKKFCDMIMSIEGVDHLDEVHAKPIGLYFLLIVKISVDAHISVYEGHNVARKVRASLETENSIKEVIVHINPAQYHPKRMNDIK